MTLNDEQKTKQKQNTIANQQKESGIKEKTLYFCTANRTFFYTLD